MLKLERLDESIVSNRLAVKTSSVSNAENDELNKLLYDDVIPAIVADIEETRWRERGAKRKQKRDTSFAPSWFQNKYGLNYERKAQPFAIMGLNECSRAVSKNRLRLLFVNNNIRSFKLINSLLVQCVQNHVPIIPMKCKQSFLSSFTTPNHFPLSIRTCCLGITTKEPPSRSLLSSLIILEDYYRTNQHVLIPFSLPAKIAYSKGKEATSRRRNAPMHDRQGKLEIGYPVMSVSEWTRSAPLVSVQVSKERKIAQREKRSVVDAFVINANGKEERLLQSVKEGSMKRSGNEQQKEATHQGAIVSPSSVPSESAIRESVDNKKENKERVIMKEDKERVIMKEDKERVIMEDKERVIMEDKENVSIMKEDKERVIMKEDKENVSIMKEDKENANKEEKERVNNKEDKKKTKTSLKSRLKGNVLFRFK
ncbi:hypothetical protein WA556_000796 [Blastocystis sp. ATCC 50177/Nand II]